MWDAPLAASLASTRRGVDGNEGTSTSAVDSAPTSPGRRN